MRTERLIITVLALCIVSFAQGEVDMPKLEGQRIAHPQAVRRRAGGSPVFFGSSSYRLNTNEGHLPIALNNLKLTPGDARTTSKADICSGRKTATIRDVTDSTKKNAFSVYGIDCSAHACGKDYEVDHLISLEIGGSNDPKNLWPEPYAGTMGAHQKDILENKLHKMICDGTITPTAAQQAIASDWVAAYQRYVKKTDGNLGR